MASSAPVLARVDDARQGQDFDNYSLNCVASLKNRFAFPDPNPGSPIADLDYAYHMDASLFAQFLRGQSEARGVKRIEGRIVDQPRPEDGFVDMSARRRAKSTAIVFVDCSGMRALLIGDAMGLVTRVGASGCCATGPCRYRAKACRC